jgi:ABC-2 type transport system ATP-binding protein
MTEVERLCDDVLVMKNGTIVDKGSPLALLDRYDRPTLEEVFLDIARDRRGKDGAAP